MTYVESVFFQRAAAAFRADSLRCSAVSFAARALPPLSPPRRPSATAAGSFPSSGTNLGASSVASSTSWRASSFTSVGLRERSGIDQGAYHTAMCELVTILTQALRGISLGTARCQG